MEQPQTGMKVKKMRRYEQRLADKHNVLTCRDCGIETVGKIPMEEHQRAKQHGPFRMRIAPANPVVAAPAKAEAAYIEGT
jgi:hypothetical protein